MSKQNPQETPAPAADVTTSTPALAGISSTRRQLIAMATVACGATVASAMFKPAHADLVAKIGKIFYLDSIVLNFAFEMEELEKDLYTRLSQSKGWGYLGGEERNLIALFAQQDSAHFDVLNAARDALGYKDAGSTETLNTFASRRSRFFKYPALNDRESVLNTALDVKESVLFGYHGAVGIVRSKELLATAAAIAGVEGRHAAALRQSIGLRPVPAPFEGAYAAQQTGYKLAKYGFQGGTPR